MDLEFEDGRVLFLQKDSRHGFFIEVLNDDFFIAGRVYPVVNDPRIESILVNIIGKEFLINQWEVWDAKMNKKPVVAIRRKYIYVTINRKGSANEIV